MLTLTDRDDGRTLTAAAGTTLELRLAENATAGYSWTVERADPALLAPAGTGSDYPGGATGSGGTAVLRFTVRGTGTAPLVLRYWRPWEGEGSVLKRFSVTVTAGG